ncbi:hypothetical protein BDF20DRAFT_906115 [Mycotypha africana]|uniref:uncharacterized protein n=1 Tax=Mycotypha africana TaxID=64632 RepID=UPI0022FFEE75|nr:uncharacterized protein BDF20DRAFT_906115 [Mycotypha africana]KAI8979516.1 hypothetical protein BDF20DRAFT_906115 [Mycotypha africana]
MDRLDISALLSGILALIICSSAVILAVQRSHLHRSQSTDSAPLRFDHKRDLSAPHNDDTHRLTRITFGTIILSALAALTFYKVVNSQEPSNWTVIAVACTQFIAWLYTTVLVLVSRRYCLPNDWGWTLNVHLFIIYIVFWSIAAQDLYEAYVNSPSESWIHMLPNILSVLIGTDLVYTTATTERGPPFVDDAGKQVAGINVASIFSYFYYQWVTPLIDLAYKKKSLNDDDLPTLPPEFRGHNLYYIFGATRGKSLMKRIILVKKNAFIIQFILAIFTSLAYYAPAFFVNQLLQLIEKMNGVKDSESLRKGFVIVAFLGITIFTLGLMVGQLWYYASSCVEVPIRAMLNIEIYRKTLRRRDLAVESPKVEEDGKDDKKNENKEEQSVQNKDDVSSTTGTIVNLMSTDSKRVSEFSVWWFSLIAAPTELTVGIYYLYKLLGKSCFLGLLVMIIVLPLNHYNAKMFARTQDKLMEARDKRIALMNEVLQGIRQIKFFAWENNWEKRIMEARKLELHHIGITYLSEVLFTFLWQGSPILVTLISFWSFTKIEGRDLTAPIAFTAITVFNELRFALNVLPECMIWGYQALISVRRIETYLTEVEIDPPNPEDNMLRQSNSSDSITIAFENATVGWSKESYSDDPTVNNATMSSSFVLKDLNIEFPNGQLSLISGSTGSGKTLLMLSLLGEAIIIEGKVRCPRQPITDTVYEDFDTLKDVDSKNWLLPYAVAYVSQVAWLQNASIRDNILFGLPYIESRYKQTIYACALNKDLSILEDGDLTEIGEKGITLSGGQKARVSLARAVYSRAQNVLMDDVLSAVDAHTAKHLYEKCLLGPLMKDRTRILITHHVSLCLKGCSYIVHIDNGRASFVGAPNVLQRSEGFASIVDENEEDTIEEEESAAEEQSVEGTLALDSNEANLSDNATKKPRALIEDETKATGMVKLRLYSMYIRMVGSPIFWFIMAALVLGSRGLDITESWWIKKWSNSYTSQVADNDLASFQQHQTIVPSTKPMYAFPMIISSTSDTLNNSDIVTESTSVDLNYYLSIYCLITLSNIIVGSARFAVLFWGVLAANRSLYAELLHRVFRAPLRFFDTTPVGRILNRFSKDFETIDSSIPNDLMNFVIQWVIIISSMFTVGSVLPIFLLPMVVVAAVNIWLGVKFVSASRELKRMDSVTRSPLFSNFTETIIGISTIRAYGATRRFLREMLGYIDINARPYYYAWIVNRWISIRYAFTGAVINCFTCTIILLSVSETMNASLAGFCLSFVLLFTDQMFWGIRRYTSLEMSFNAVERVVEFMEMDQEAPSITELRPPAEWPSKGAVEVKDLEVRYAADLEPVLRGISFNIKPQEKVGVVGRTGSGKSTLALSFFRFVEASRGSITIDGINIKDLGTEDLRSNLTIIPQDPTLFSGSLRSNLDPFDQFSDEEIFVALRRVHLLPTKMATVASETADASEPSVDTLVSDSTLDEVNVNVFQDLSTAVTEGGKNFSQGQRQLLCLARAILKRSRIVIMDEATASVDFDTDKAIQKTISTEFASATILCIAHRLHTVIEYDRILVLDKGEIVEFDNPLTLLENSESAFYKMCRNSGEFESLLALCKVKHELVDVSSS